VQTLFQFLSIVFMMLSLQLLPPKTVKLLSQLPMQVNFTIR
jgi:hypothetical protein